MLNSKELILQNSLRFRYSDFYHPRESGELKTDYKNWGKFNILKKENNSIIY